jgi:hypothetical protein
VTSIFKPILQNTIGLMLGKGTRQTIWQSDWTGLWWSLGKRNHVGDNNGKQLDVAQKNAPKKQLGGLIGWHEVIFGCDGITT